VAASRRPCLRQAGAEVKPNYRCLAPILIGLGLLEIHRRGKVVRKTTGVGGGEDEQRALEGVEGEGRDGLFISREGGGWE
jgi:hypothetical protein